MNERMTLGQVRSMLEPVNDRILRGLHGEDGASVEVRRSSYQIEGGGAYYLLSFTVLPEGERRQETPRLKGMGCAS